MEYKKNFQEVLNELISEVTTYREWNLNNCSIKDCEDHINDIEKNTLDDIINDSLSFSYGDVPHFFDTYIQNNTIHRYYYYKYKFIQHSRFNYYCYKEDIILNYPPEVCKDYCEMVLNEILQTNPLYDLNHGYYNSIDDYKLRWISKYNIPYNSIIYYFKNHIYYYNSYEFIYNIYKGEIKKKLNKLICNEKLNILDKKMLNSLNIDCWKLICDYVC